MLDIWLATSVCTAWSPGSIRWKVNLYPLQRTVREPRNGEFEDFGTPDSRVLNLNIRSKAFHRRFRNQSTSSFSFQPQASTTSLLSIINHLCLLTIYCTTPMDVDDEWRKVDSRLPWLHRVPGIGERKSRTLGGTVPCSVRVPVILAAIVSVRFDQRRACTVRSRKQLVLFWWPANRFERGRGCTRQRKHSRKSPARPAIDCRRKAYPSKPVAGRQTTADRHHGHGSWLFRRDSLN